MPRPSPGRLIGTFGLAAALLLVRIGTAPAFPLLDAENTAGVPLGTELSGPDAQDLRHQLQLANGLSAPAGGGWTFVPRIDWQEELTDNALQAHSPRRADLVSFLSPGIGIAGEVPRVKLTFDFAPTLTTYARTSNLNSLTEQMSGLGNVTLAPDLAFVDIRAVAGVQSLNGGVGGLGGASGAGAASSSPSAGSIPSLAGNSQGLNRNNETQTTSFAISPYLVRRFGDWGTGRLGYSLEVTESDSIGGFAAAPFPTGGANARTLVTNEQTGHFVSGDILEYLQDSFDVDLTQTQTTTGSSIGTAQSGIPSQTTHTSSTRAIVTDQLSYEINRSLSVFVSGGHESIHYTGLGGQSIDGLTWSFGSTWTPNPDSQLTLSYGHHDGANSLSANGHYALTPRTLLSVSYGSTLGTQLEQVQNQLNLATRGNGGLVNGQTGGQLFGSSNALALQDGVFRTTTLTVGTQTALDRDTFALNLLLTKQVSTSATNARTSSSKSVSANWTHLMRPDMTVGGSVSYAIQEQNSGISIGSNLGNNTIMTASLVWQWHISDTLSASLRYSFLERQSPVSVSQLYQDMLILGISKTF